MKNILLSILLAFSSLSFAEKGPEYQLIDEGQMRVAVNQMMPQITSMLIQANPKFQGLESVFIEFFREADFYGFLVEHSAKKYRDNFTTEELEVLAEFYNSDLGRKFTNFQVSSLGNNDGIQEFMVENQPLLMKLIKENLTKNK